MVIVKVPPFLLPPSSLASEKGRGYKKWSFDLDSKLWFFWQQKLSLHLSHFSSKKSELWQLFLCQICKFLKSLNRALLRFRGQKWLLPWYLTGGLHPKLILSIMAKESHQDYIFLQQWYDRNCLLLCLEIEIILEHANNSQL